MEIVLNYQFAYFLFHSIQHCIRASFKNQGGVIPLPMWLWLKLKCSEQHFISWLWYNIGSLSSETFSKLNKTKTGSLFASIHISSGLWHPIKTANKAVLQYTTHLTCWGVTPQPLVCEIAAGEVTRTSCSCHVSCSIILCSSLDVTCHDPILQLSRVKQHQELSRVMQHHLSVWGCDVVTQVWCLVSGGSHQDIDTKVAQQRGTIQTAAAAAWPSKDEDDNCVYQTVIVRCVLKIVSSSRGPGNAPHNLFSYEQQDTSSNLAAWVMCLDGCSVPSCKQKLPPPQLLKRPACPSRGWLLAGDTGRVLTANC